MPLAATDELVYESKITNYNKSMIDLQIESKNDSNKQTRRYKASVTLNVNWIIKLVEVIHWPEKKQQYLPYDYRPIC